MYPHSPFPSEARAFSLVEVVLALAVVSFALVSVVGLLSVGLKSNKESSDQIQAANLASLLVATRRGMPTNAISNFALPPLNQNTAGTATAGINGRTALASGLPGADAYKLQYAVSTNALQPGVATVYLLLWWPATLAAAPTNNAGGYYELSTQVVLP